MINAQNELICLQRKFTDYFAGRTVYDIRTRNRLLFGILRLGMAEREIRREKNRFKRAQLLTEFTKKRDILRGVFFYVQSGDADRDSKKQPPLAV